MADVVRYVCANGGDSGFPFALDRTGVLDPSVYPVAVAQTTLVKWWWRVRNWYLDTDLIVTDSLGNNFPLPPGVLPQNNASVVRELNLISGSNYDVGASHSFLTSAANSGAQISVISGGVGILAGLFYPFLGIFGNAGNAATGEIVALASNTLLQPFAVNATLDGISIPLYSTTNGAGVTFTCSKFDITPNLYWPYKALNNPNPIWDTATGAALQSPTA